MLAGFTLAVIYDQVNKYIRSRRELSAAGNIKIEDGIWYAAWQTSVNGQPNVNVEQVEIKQRAAKITIRNLEVSSDNEAGGYLWKGDLKLYHSKKVIGWYAPAIKGERDSMGTLYYIYFSARKVFLGQWVGAAIDGDLCRGYSVIAKTPAIAKDLLQCLIEQQPMKAQFLSDIASLGVKEHEE